jgi:drug/metabolite transporter (DMT)-like permease
MFNAYLFMALGLLSFASMGICHKLADRYHCDPLNVTVYAMCAAFVYSVVYNVIFRADSLISIPMKVVLLAVPFGVCASAAFWFFQRGLRYGKIATSWLLINLSAAVPTVLSIVIYHEPINKRKVAVLILIIISLLLLWKDRQQDEVKSAMRSRVQ